MPAKFIGRTMVQAAVAAAVMSVSSASALFAFTADQSEAGKTAYMSNCAQCHGTQLEGPEAPGLFGQDVMGNWDTAGGLYDFISVAMPPAAPGQLGEETYLAIVAYVMQENGAVADDAALTVAGMGEVSLVAATKDRAAEIEAARHSAAGGEAAPAESVTVPQAYTWGKELPQFKQ